MFLQFNYTSVYYYHMHIALIVLDIFVAMYIFLKSKFGF